MSNCPGTTAKTICESGLKFWFPWSLLTVSILWAHLTDWCSKSTMSTKSLFDIEEVFAHFYRGCLDINEENVEQIRSFVIKYPESFKAFDGGVSISLKEDTFTILKHFRSIKKIVVKLDGSSNVAEKLGRAIQGFANITEITLSGCRLDDEGVMEVLDSVRNPRGVEIIDFRNNPITASCLQRIRAKLVNVQSLLTDLIESPSSSMPAAAPSYPVPVSNSSQRMNTPSESDLALYALYMKVHDCESAMKIKQSADNGNPLAQAYMAKIYFTGHSLEKNLVESTQYGMLSLQWVREQANAGHHCAQECMGAFLSNKIAVVEDQLEAHRFFLLSATQGNAVGQYTLGGRYYSGLHVTEDAVEGVRWLKLAVDQGFPLAYQAVAQAYYFGKGVPLDKVTAANYWRAGADLGIRSCMYNLGLQYRDGHGVQQDKLEAMRLFKLAGEANQGKALYSIAAMYFKADGVPMDKERAMEYFLKAAHAGHAVAQINIAVGYVHGTTLPKNQSEGARYMKMAADQGNAQAQYNLGLYFLEGTGVGVDEKEGIRLLTLSAEQGHTNAMNYLGIAYFVGKYGMTPDKVRGALWLQLAASKGNATAMKNFKSKGCAQTLARAGKDIPADLAEQLKNAAMQAVKDAVLDFAKEKAKEKIQEGLNMALSAVCVIM